MGSSASRTTTSHTAKRATRTRSALRLDRHRAQELLVLRRQLGREGAAGLGAREEDAGVGAALEDLLHGVARSIGGRERRLDRLHELLEERVDVTFLRHGSLRYHTAAMASWSPLASAIRYTRGKLALREDTWRLPDGTERVYPVLVSGPGVAVLPFVEPDRVLLVRQYRHLQRAMSWELPGGGVLPGEAPEAAAQRE